MNFYHHMQIGESHRNHCEDYLIIEDYASNKTLCAAMDGCTMGNESYFIATLIGKVLKKIAKELNYAEFLNKKESRSDLKSDLKNIFAILINEIKSYKNQLLLEKEDVLSTLIIMAVDRSKFKAEIIVIGDGLVCIDGKMHEFEQDNIPDYLGYHLGEDFGSWFNKISQKISVESFNDLSISTDGIFTFEKLGKERSVGAENVVHNLLIDREGMASELMIRNKINSLEKQNIKPIDDIGIIRVIKDI